MTIVRVINIHDLGDIDRAMQRAPEVFQDAVRLDLFNVLMSDPKTAMMSRVPIATTRRYQNYNRRDGKVTKVSYRGSVTALQKAADVPPRVSGNTVEFGVRAQSDLTYAAYVHDRVKPAEGHYWVEGSHGLGRGWTTKGTGNKFVQRSVEKYADWIPETLTKLIDKRMEGHGL